MTEDDKKRIRKMQAILQKIDNGESVFFNITQYKRLGLIVLRRKWGIDVAGNKVQTGLTYHLTEAAKKYLQVIV